MQNPSVWGFEYDAAYGACSEFWDKEEQITVFTGKSGINNMSCCTGRIFHSIMLK